MTAPSTEPVALRAARPEPAEGLVEAVERLLAEVRAGTIRELAWAARRRGDEIETCLAGETDDAFRMLGAVRFLEVRIIGTIER